MKMKILSNLVVIGSLILGGSAFAEQYKVTSGPCSNGFGPSIAVGEVVDLNATSKGVSIVSGDFEVANYKAGKTITNGMDTQEVDEGKYINSGSEFVYSFLGTAISVDIKLKADGAIITSENGLTETCELEKLK